MITLFITVTCMHTFVTHYDASLNWLLLIYIIIHFTHCINVNSVQPNSLNAEQHQI